MSSTETWQSRGKEVRATDPKTGGQKGQKPERCDLIPADALMELARVYGEGAKKYEDNNYLKGYPWSWSLASLWRHILRWMLGEDVDPETGCHHLMHAAWHCFTLYVFAVRGLGTDDRATPGPKTIPLYGRLGTVTEPKVVTRNKFFDGHGPEDFGGSDFP